MSIVGSVHTRPQVRSKELPDVFFLLGLRTAGVSLVIVAAKTKTEEKE